MITAPKVFISYSHDTMEHMDRVREVADKLRMEGVDCDLDQYEEAPAEGWPRWMHSKIKESKFVLVVCTESYFKRIEGKRDEEEKEAGYEDLYRRLIEQPKINRPQLGKIKIPEVEKLGPIPRKKVKSSPAALLLSPIDVKLWDAAEWSATFFIGGEGMVPTLGIAYRNEVAGRKIFEGWRARFGNIDASEELRIAIIDGPIEDEEDGYSVHISLDPKAFDKKMRCEGMAEGLWSGVMVSRINRMTPLGGLANLERFKADVAKHQKYVLAPGVVSEDGRKFKPLLSLGIQKNNIVFKHSSEIDEHDLDSIVLKSGLRKRKRQQWTIPGSKGR